MNFIFPPAEACFMLLYLTAKGVGGIRKTISNGFARAETLEATKMLPLQTYGKTNDDGVTGKS